MKRSDFQRGVIAAASGSGVLRFVINASLSSRRLHPGEAERQQAEAASEPCRAAQ